MWHVMVLTMLVSLGAMSGTAAALCSKEDFGKAVDQAGAALRKLNADNAPRLRAKMRELKDHKAWSDADFEEKALAAVQDERIEAYNAQANDLLAKLDALGNDRARQRSRLHQAAGVGGGRLGTAGHHQGQGRLHVVKARPNVGADAASARPGAEAKGSRGAQARPRGGKPPPAPPPAVAAKAGPR